MAECCWSLLKHPLFYGSDFIDSDGFVLTYVFNYNSLLDDPWVI